MLSPNHTSPPGSRAGQCFQYPISSTQLSNTRGPHFSQAAGTALPLRLAFPDDSLLANAPSKTLLLIFRKHGKTTVIRLKMDEFTSKDRDLWEKKKEMRARQPNTVLCLRGIERWEWGGQTVEISE